MKPTKTFASAALLGLLLSVPSGLEPYPWEMRPEPEPEPKPELENLRRAQSRRERRAAKRKALAARGAR